MPGGVGGGGSNPPPTRLTTRLSRGVPGLDSGILLYLGIILNVVFERISAGSIPLCRPASSDDIVSHHNSRRTVVEIDVIDLVVPFGLVDVVGEVPGNHAAILYAAKGIDCTPVTMNLVTMMDVVVQNVVVAATDVLYSVSGLLADLHSAVGHAMD